MFSLDGQPLDGPRNQNKSPPRIRTPSEPPVTVFGRFLGGGRGITTALPELYSPPSAARRKSFPFQTAAQRKSVRQSTPTRPRPETVPSVLQLVLKTVRFWGGEGLADSMGGTVVILAQASQCNSFCIVLLCCVRRGSPKCTYPPETKTGPVGTIVVTKKWTTGGGCAGGRSPLEGP